MTNATPWQLSWHRSGRHTWSTVAQFCRNLRPNNSTANCLLFQFLVARGRADDTFAPSRTFLQSFIFSWCVCVCVCVCGVSHVNIDSKEDSEGSDDTGDYGLMMHTKRRSTSTNPLHDETYGSELGSGTQGSIKDTESVLSQKLERHSTMSSLDHKALVRRPVFMSDDSPAVPDFSAVSEGQSASVSLRNSPRKQRRDLQLSSSLASSRSSMEPMPQKPKPARDTDASTDVPATAMDLFGSDDDDDSSVDEEEIRERGIGSKLRFRPNWRDGLPRPEQDRGAIFAAKTTNFLHCLGTVHKTTAWRKKRTFILKINGGILSVGGREHAFAPPSKVFTHGIKLRLPGDFQHTENEQPLDDVPILPLGDPAAAAKLPATLRLRNVIAHAKIANGKVLLREGALRLPGGDYDPKIAAPLLLRFRNPRVTVGVQNSAEIFASGASSLAAVHLGLRKAAYWLECANLLRPTASSEDSGEPVQLTWDNARISNIMATFTMPKRINVEKLSREVHDADYNVDFKHWAEFKSETPLKCNAQIYPSGKIVLKGSNSISHVRRCAEFMQKLLAGYTIDDARIRRLERAHERERLRHQLRLVADRPAEFGVELDSDNDDDDDSEGDEFLDNELSQMSIALPPDRFFLA
ncbi:MAG: hypothetical protein MHM6MM_002336 [Cercozoa sp. M6MM]